MHICGFEKHHLQYYLLDPLESNNMRQKCHHLQFRCRYFALADLYSKQVVTYQLHYINHFSWWQRRNLGLPTMPCFQWDILYMWSCGLLVTTPNCKIGTTSDNYGVLNMGDWSRQLVPVSSQ